MFVKPAFIPTGSPGGAIVVYIDMVKTLLVAAVLAVQTATPIFRFETDGFWLNLHHFLYVLGRVEAKMPDIKREAVAGAPADEAQGLKTLSDAERQAWRQAVTAYANGLSKLEAIFDRRGLRRHQRRAAGLARSRGAAACRLMSRWQKRSIERRRSIARRGGRGTATRTASGCSRCRIR